VVIAKQAVDAHMWRVADGVQYVLSFHGETPVIL
jgi:hypothetical protein